MIKLFTIDASIAKSAGGEDASYPTSQHTTSFLNHILTHQIRVILPPELHEEWKRHQSNFTIRWRSSMMAKDLIDLSPINKNRRLRNRVRSKTKCANSHQMAMLKDIHLIEGTTTRFSTISSLDDNVRHLFSKHYNDLEIIDSIYWIHPTEEFPDGFSWLANEMPRSPQRFLSNYINRKASKKSTASPADTRRK